MKIKQILLTAQVRIACLQDDPNHIIGYVVYTKEHLDWIYVKEQYRKKGIGTMLLPKGIKTVTETQTKIGKSIAAKKNLNTKEMANGPSTSGQTDQRIQGTASSVRKESTSTNSN